MKRAALLLAILSPLLPAQVVLKLSPEPMAVPLSVLANAHQMGRWQIEGCNVGATLMTLSPEQIDIASTIPFIDTADASLVLQGNVNRTFWAQAKRYLSLAGGLASIALSVKGGVSTGWVAAVGVVPTVVPQLIDIASGQIPSAAPLLVQLNYPLTLAPGQCFTDHKFAGKMKKPVAVVVTIPTAAILPSPQNGPATPLPAKPAAVHAETAEEAGWVLAEMALALPDGPSMFLP